MPASFFKRFSKLARSGNRLGGGFPLTRKLIGPSKRVMKGRILPLSILNDKSRKSRAISRLLRLGAITRPGLKCFIGGKSTDGAFARRPMVLSFVGACEHAEMARPSIRKRKRMNSGPLVFDKRGHNSNSIIKFVRSSVYCSQSGRGMHRPLSGFADIAERLAKCDRLILGKSEIT